jgi:hypothetical protein
MRFIYKGLVLQFAFLCLFAGAARAASLSASAEGAEVDPGTCGGTPEAVMSSTCLPNCFSNGEVEGNQPPSPGHRTSDSFPCDDEKKKADAIEKFMLDSGVGADLCTSVFCFSGACGPDGIISSPHSFWKLKLHNSCDKKATTAKTAVRAMAAEPCMCYYEFFNRDPNQQGDKPIIEATSCSCH